MNMVQNPYFQAGFAFAAIMLAAAVMSPVLRAVAVGLMAVGALWLLFEHGPDGIAAALRVLRWKLYSTPQFAKGMLVGAVITGVAFACAKQRRKRAQ
jgi:hypothetical protein